MIARLQRLVDGGVLRPLDLRFAALSAAREPGDPWIAGISAALVSWRAGQGDVCVPLAEYAGRMLFPRRDAVDEVDALPPIVAPRLDEWRGRLEACRWVGQPGDWQPLILDCDHLYLGRFHSYETRVANWLSARLGQRIEVDQTRLSAGLERLFPGGDAALDWQRVAVAVATLRPFAVISGGPGTGKTTTVVKLLALLLEQRPELRISLAAPTGKAADRLASTVAALKTGLPVDDAVLATIPETASTLHRLLGADRHGRFRRDGHNPLHADVVVLDEASMVDLPMMARLLDALPPSARLILLGDRDQLASVEAGRVLGDICGHGRALGFSPAMVAQLEACGAAPVDALRPDPGAPEIADAIVALRVSHRFDAASGIGRLAHAIQATANGFDPGPLVAACDDVVWLDAAAPAPGEEVIAWATTRYAAMLAADGPDEALARFASARVLCTVHHGEFGVARLNARIEAALHRGSRPGGERDHYHGQPLLVTRNDYGQRLYNGDVGIVWDDGAGLAAWFPLESGGTPRRVALHDLPPHETAFAMSVHKSQGSEFDEVLFVLPPTPSPAATRELVYTAVTRARRRLSVAAAVDAFTAATGRAVDRHTRLAGRLGWPGPGSGEA